MFPGSAGCFGQLWYRTVVYPQQKYNRPQDIVEAYPESLKLKAWYQDVMFMNSCSPDAQGA